MIVPDKKARQKANEEQNENDSSASSRKSENKPVKKKKRSVCQLGDHDNLIPHPNLEPILTHRQLGSKAAVMTEDDILEVTRNVELESGMVASKSGNIRRMRVS